MTRAQTDLEATVVATEEAPPPPSGGTIPTEGAVSVHFLVYVPVIILAGLLIGAFLLNSRLTGFLATLVPPEVAAKIYQDGVRFGFQIALNQAARTPGTLDDEFFEEMARLRGLQVTKRADGTYDVIQPSPPTGATKITDPTERETSQTRSSSLAANGVPFNPSVGTGGAGTK